MSQNPVYPTRAAEGLVEEQAPWFEAHWADMVSSRVARGPLTPRGAAAVELHQEPSQPTAVRVPAMAARA